MKRYSTPRGFVTVGTLIVLLASFPMASSLLMKLGATGEYTAVAEEAPESDIVLVLGAAAYPNGLSDILADRMDTAIELLEKDKALKMFLSGAPNEVEKMKEYAIEKGVSEGDLIEDPDGLNTRKSLENIEHITGKVLIVTQEFHLPRALFIARTLGLNAHGVASDRRSYTRIFEFKKREILAASKAMAEVFLLK